MSELYDIDPNGPRKAAHEAALKTLREARALLVEAQEIMRATDHDVDALSVGEALMYVDEILA